MLGFMLGIMLASHGHSAIPKPPKPRPKPKGPQQMTAAQRTFLSTALSLKIRAIRGDKSAADLVCTIRSAFEPETWDAIERAAANVAKIRVTG